MGTNLELLQDLGLSKNEAKIYMTLLEEGVSSVGQISDNAKVHRRNAYDAIKRLLEKGLVVELFQKKENYYQAIDPRKLSELLEEKQNALTRMMPSFVSLFESKSLKEETFNYKGLEGYKNEMRDVLRMGQDFYCIGAKGLWADPRMKTFTEKFASEVRKKKINFHILFDCNVGENHKTLTQLLGWNYRFLPKGYSTDSSIDIFGDRVLIFSIAEVNKVDEDITLTVIINQRVADAFRTWFKLLWSFCTP